MPATIPNSFTTGTDIDALKLQANQEAVRKYINRDIVLADLENECVDYQEIVKGEYRPASRDHQFTFGDLYTQFSDTQIFNRSYFTGCLKQTTDLTTATQYIKIPNTGKRFYLEEDALVIYHAWIQIVINEENLAHTIPGLDQTIFLDIDNGRVAESYTLAFSDSPASGTAGGFELTLRRSFPFSYISFESAGWHEISLSINMDTQQGYAGARNVTIETIIF